jgi:hypothetical protein
MPRRRAHSGSIKYVLEPDRYSMEQPLPYPRGPLVFESRRLAQRAIAIELHPRPYRWLEPIDHRQARPCELYRRELPSQIERNVSVSVSMQGSAPSMRRPSLPEPGVIYSDMRYSSFQSMGKINRCESRLPGFVGATVSILFQCVAHLHEEVR